MQLHSMGRFILGLVIGACLILGAEYLYVAHGGLQMATERPPLPMERFLAHEALVASIGKTAQLQSPLPADEANLFAGLRVYQQNGCGECHGNARGGAGALAKGLFPHPPELLPPSTGVSDDPVGRTYWVVKNGIRLSGMPSFAGRLNESQLWQVSLFLSKTDKLPTALRDELEPK